MKIKIILLIIAILIITSCNDNVKNKPVESKDLEYDINPIKSLEERIKFHEKFKSICIPKNIIPDFNIKNTLFENVRRNSIINFTRSEGLGIDGSITREEFTLCEIYDNTPEAFHGKYGYTIFMKQALFNITKDIIYFIFWKNEETNYGSTRPYFLKYNFELINENTHMVITNLHLGLVKKIFNYNGPINKYKIDRVLMKRVYCDNLRLSEIESTIYADSTTFIEYKKVVGESKK